jgi:hypothetical protein
MKDVVTAREGYKRPISVRQLQITMGRRAATFRQRNSESRCGKIPTRRDLMRGGKQTVIGPRAFQSVASRLLYTPFLKHRFDETVDACRPALQLKPD